MPDQHDRHPGAAPPDRGPPGPAAITRRAAALLLAAPALLPRRVRAQAPWPSDKPVRLVVTLAPGGTADFLARGLAQRLQEVTGLNFVVENRTGGSGAVGWQAAARAAPDAATLLVMDNSLPIAAAAGRDIGFNLARDLEPVWPLAQYAPIVVVNPALPVTDLRSFVDYAKARPGALFYGSNGIGSVTHLQTELLQAATGMRLNHVSYRGMAQAATDLVAGQVHVMLPVFPTVAGQIRGGALKPIAVSTEGPRIPALPEVPSAREGGIDFAEGTWFGLMAPRGTPREALATMRAALAAAASGEAYRRRLEESGATVPDGRASPFGDTVTREVALWTRVLRERNIAIE